MNEFALSNQSMIEIKKAFTTRRLNVNINLVPLKAYAEKALNARRISDSRFDHTNPFM